VFKLFFFAFAARFLSLVAQRLWQVFSDMLKSQLGLAA
jgi:hypothetical protein